MEGQLVFNASVIFEVFNVHNFTHVKYRICDTHLLMHKPT